MTPPAPCLHFLADFSPISADFQLNVYNVLVLLGALVAFWASLRRKPSVDVDLTELSSAIKMLVKSHEKLEAARELHAGHSAQIAAVERESRALKDQLEREIASQRKYSMELSREIFAHIKSENDRMGDKMDAMRTTVEALFRDMSTEIGGLKEAVKHGQS